MKAIILVGGQGSRMRPLTNRLPKNIVPVCGVPFLTYQIEYLKSVGIKEIVFSIGYRAEDIRAVYGDGRKQKVKIHYALEKTPLGTAGALKNAEKYVQGSSVIVLNGDILTDIPLASMIQFHRRHKNLATLGLVRVEDPTAYGLVLLDSQNRVTRFLEKPASDEVITDTINAGVYLFERGVFDYIPAGKNYSAERALFPNLLKDRKPVGGFVWEGYWQDIGTPWKYLTTHWDVLNGSFPVLAKLTLKSNKIYMGPNVRVGRSALLKGPAIIEEGCVIGEGARILPYAVLGKKCVIGKNSSVSRSVLWDGVSLGESVQLEEVVLGRKSRILDFTKLAKGSVLGDHSKV